MKRIVLETVVAVCASAGPAGAAGASEAILGSGYVGEAPVDAADLVRQGAITVAGIVHTTGTDGLVLEDGTGLIPVELEERGAFAPVIGEAITVLGVLDDDHVEARRLIREDGTVVQMAED